MITAVATSFNDDAVPRVAVFHITDRITLVENIHDQTRVPSLELLSSPRAVLTRNQEITIRCETRDITFGMNDQEITTLRYDRRRWHDLKANPFDHVIGMHEVNDVSFTYGSVFIHINIIRVVADQYKLFGKLCEITI